MAEQEQKTESTILPVYRRRWFKWNLALLILLLVFLTVLPIGVRYAAIDLLQEQGIQQIEIDDVDLNLFTGEFGLSGVRVSGDGQGRATLSKFYANLSILALLKKRIRLQQFELTGLDLDLQYNDAGEWIVAGILPPLPAPADDNAAQQPPSEPWGVGIDQLKLTGINVHFVMPKLQSNVRVDELQLTQLVSWRPQQDSNIQVKMHIDQAPLSLSAQMQPFNSNPQLNGTLTLDQLPLALVSEFAQEAGVEKLQGHLAVATEFNAKLEAEQPQLESKTKVSFSDLEVKQGQYDIRTKQFVVATEFKAKLEAEQPQLESKTKVTLSDLEVKQGQYDIQTKQFTWDGQVDYVTPSTEQDLGVRVNGAVLLKQFSLFDQQTEMSLALIEQLNVNDVVLTENKTLQIKTIALEQLDLVQKQEQDRLARLAAIKVTEFDFDGQHALAINDITINGLKAKILINPDGEIHLLDELLHSTSTPKEGETTSVEAESEETAAVKSGIEPWQIRLARLHISDDSHIVFDDQKSKPPQFADVRPFSITISNIDTAVKDQDILIDVQAIINKHEQLSGNAKIKPFTEKLNMSAEGQITSLDLPPFSHYLNQQIGYYIEKGRLNSTMTMTVVDDFLDAKLHIELKKFHIKEGDPAKAKGFSDNLTMPLDTALGMLRDKHDNIELDIPVEGDINDPEFNINQVINKALVKSTSVAVTGYLVFALQPWGAALAVAHIAGKAVGSVSLDPIMFDPGQVALKDEYNDYFAKIKLLLEERPEIGLQICGLASEQDRLGLFAALQEEKGEQKAEQAKVAELVKNAISNLQLLDLAKQRTSLVIQALIDSGADAGRLFSCRPDMGGVEKNSPSVLLFI